MIVDQFEAWALSINMSVSKNERGGYSTRDARLAWLAWHASRKNMQVSLIDLVSVDAEDFAPCSDFYDRGVKTVLVKLIERGVDIKP